MNSGKRTILITPVGSQCNLRCIYCYHAPVRDNSKLMVMPRDILEKTMAEGLQWHENIDFLWHGGEPLLAGLEFFEEAMNLQKKYSMSNKRVRNIVQTNATLIDKRWAEFFCRENFIVSSSMDGPEKIHDANRVKQDSEGSFASVLAGIEEIKMTGKNVGLLAVITNTNVRYPDEVYQALRKIGSRSFELHFCSKTEVPVVDLIADKKYLLNFYQRLFDLWIEENNPEFRVRTFTNIIRAFFDGKTLDCASRIAHCRFFVAVDEEGNLYACHRFLKRDEFLLGNITEKSFEQIMRDGEEIYDALSQMSSQCKKCEWLKYCGGGCAHERWIHFGRFDVPHPYCDFKKELFRYVTNKIKSI